MLGGVAGCGTPGPSTTVLEPVALAIGQPAPPLSGRSLDGSRTIDLASFKGRPIVVNFWASWCVPCRQEFGIFKTALERHSGDGLEVIGVVFKDDPAPAAAFAKAQAAGWPDVTDPDGSIAKRYRVIAPPQTYFIDRNGVVRDRQIGQVASDDEMERLLAGILR